MIPNEILSASFGQDALPRAAVWLAVISGLPFLAPGLRPGPASLHGALRIPVGGRAFRASGPGPRSLSLAGGKWQADDSGPATAPGPEEMIVMMFWYGSGWAWWQAGLMWVGMIAFWALLIWAVYAVVKSITTRDAGQPEPSGGRPAADPRRILDERLARGEIDSDEYLRLRDLLDGS